jgi:cell division protein FtsB
MSRSAAARTHRYEERSLRRPRPDGSHGVAHTRRMSGPARPAGGSAEQAQAYATAPEYRPPRQRTHSRPVRPPLRLAAGGAAIALRLADSAVNVSGSRTMDRLVRSRAWVVIIGLGLIGIVAMQVSMLKLNSGIGRAVDTAATLERGNASLKAQISELSSGDRIQSIAGQRGFVMPEPADVTYLRAGDKRSDGFQAARRMRAPDPTIAGPAGAVSAAKAPDSLTGATSATGAAATTPATQTGIPDAPATAPAAPPVTPAATPAPPAATAPPVTAAPTATPTATGAVSAAPPAPQTTAAGGVTSP